MMATKESFTFLVAAHAGVSIERASRASDAVLAAIGAYLSAPFLELVAEELPPGLARALRAGSGLAAPIDERVLDPGATAGQARELIASVCRALAEDLSNDALTALRRSLPPEIAELLTPPAPEAPRRAAPGAHRETLAEGRPGSRRSLSEGQSGGAHTDSVRAENPHMATKLSSATGSTQERRGETLAEGHAGPSHRLAGAAR